MQEHIIKPGEEWGGHSSSKFLPSKKHITVEHAIDPQYKQMFDSKGRAHFDPGRGHQSDWKPSVRQIDFAKIHEVPKPSAKGRVNAGKI